MAQVVCPDIEHWDTLRDLSIAYKCIPRNKVQSSKP